MKKIIAILAAVALVNIAYAQEPEYTFREGVRSTVVSNILGSAATAAGDLSIASNLYVAGNAVVTGTVAVTGASTLTGTLNVNAIDGVGAVDIDYGSADITDHTFTSDGGTVILDGAITASGAATIHGTATLNGLTTTGAVSITQGALVGVSTTNKFYSVAFADEANCVTTTVITVNGIVVTGSSTL